jgi:hypothetical protein
MSNHSVYKWVYMVVLAVTLLVCGGLFFKFTRDIDLKKALILEEMEKEGYRPNSVSEYMDTKTSNVVGLEEESIDKGSEDK